MLRTTFRKAAGLVVLIAFIALAATNTASAHADYQHGAFFVTCTTRFNTNLQVVGRSITVSRPMVQTSQTPVIVSWQPVLERLYQGSWHQEVVLPQLYGSANSVQTKLPDYQPYPIGTSFTINQPGVGYRYRVQVYYRWYWNGQVFRGEWADAQDHQSVWEVGTMSDYGYGWIPLQTVTYSTGSDCYMG